VATLLLAGCLPAAAQNLLLPARTAPVTVPSFRARFGPPPLPSESSILAPGIPVDEQRQSLALAAQSLTESPETPFLVQTRVSFASRRRAP